MKTDLIVVSPHQHLFFRAVAAFIVAPYLIYRGFQNNDILLLFMGLATLIVDTYTFYKTLEIVNHPEQAELQLTLEGSQGTTIIPYCKL